MTQPALYFWVGTEAELIKLFPVMLETARRGIPYRLIATGQNESAQSDILESAVRHAPDLQLSAEKDIRKTMIGLVHWYASTLIGAPRALRAQFPGLDSARSILVVHGDTVSTLMGATVGKRLGMKVAHVEAGLRSHHWLNPFPEEIDRVLTGRKADIHFAPGAEACLNLTGAHGLIVNTTYNTLLDGLAYSRAVPCADPAVADMRNKPYFVAVLHRQENLMNRSLVRGMVDRLIRCSRQTHCVLILHKPTEVALQAMGLLDTLKQAPDVTLLPRVAYFDFMKLLDGSAFVITDGGSNQEELSYMGKPCLIIRRCTERPDGLGANALLYDGTLSSVDVFITDHTRYRRPPVSSAQSPSALIVDVLDKALSLS